VGAGPRSLVESSVKGASTASGPSVSNPYPRKDRFIKTGDGVSPARLEEWNLCSSPDSVDAHSRSLHPFTTDSTRTDTSSRRVIAPNTAGSVLTEEIWPCP